MSRHNDGGSRLSQHRSDADSGFVYMSNSSSEDTYDVDDDDDEDDENYEAKKVRRILLSFETYTKHRRKNQEIAHLERTARQITEHFLKKDNKFYGWKSTRQILKSVLETFVHSWFHFHFNPQGDWDSDHIPDLLIVTAPVDGYQPSCIEVSEQRGKYTESYQHEIRARNIGGHHAKIASENTPLKDSVKSLDVAAHIIDDGSFIVCGDIAICTFHICSRNALLCGGQGEFSYGGMLRANFCVEEGKVILRQVDLYYSMREIMYAYRKCFPQTAAAAVPTEKSPQTNLIHTLVALAVKAAATGIRDSQQRPLAKSTECCICNEDDKLRCPCHSAHNQACASVLEINGSLPLFLSFVNHLQRSREQICSTRCQQDIRCESFDGALSELSESSTPRSVILKNSQRNALQDSSVAMSACTSAESSLPPETLSELHINLEDSSSASSNLLLAAPQPSLLSADECEMLGVEEMPSRPEEYQVEPITVIAGMDHALSCFFHSVRDNTSLLLSITQVLMNCTSTEEACKIDEFLSLCYSRHRDRRMQRLMALAEAQIKLGNDAKAVEYLLQVLFLCVNNTHTSLFG